MEIYEYFIYLNKYLDFSHKLDPTYNIAEIDDKIQDIHDLIKVLSSGLKYHIWVFENWDRMLDYLSCNYDQVPIHHRLAIVHHSLPKISKIDLKNYLNVLGESVKCANNNIKLPNTQLKDDYNIKVMFMENDKAEIIKLLSGK